MQPYVRDAVIGSRTRSLVAGAVTLLALAASADTAAATADQAEDGLRTTADGVYTSEQARAGLAVHEKYCAKCHHHSYFQGAFLQPWRNQPVSELYDLIRLRMPVDRPGALRPREYVSLLAYVFELNQLPSGADPLGEVNTEMQNILISTGR
jgi:mono/diheme cytochrome c family protein